jgi:hypothetical protein
MFKKKKPKVELITGPDWDGTYMYRIIVDGNIVHEETGFYDAESAIFAMLQMKKEKRISC